MNLVLLFPEDFISTDHVKLSDYRAEHIGKILKAQPGQKLKVGLVQKGRGQGMITRIHNHTVELEVEIKEEKIEPASLSLILALPRPQTLKKVLETIGAFGLRNLFLIQTERVEKSFFQSTLLQDKAWLQYLRLGMEQGGKISLPEITLWTSFQKFKNELKEKLNVKTTRIILEAASLETLWNLPAKTWADSKEIIAAIGPEGGWLKQEVEEFCRLGFQPIRLGPTIHRVENAVTALLAQIELFRETPRLRSNVL